MFSSGRAPRISLVRTIHAEHETNSQNVDKVRGARASMRRRCAEPGDVPALNGQTVDRGKQMTKVKSTPDDTDRPTEDDVARERLGGSRGAAELDPAPMTRQRRIKTPSKDTEPGHTA
jgi:hypothetical protein